MKNKKVRNAVMVVGILLLLSLLLLGTIPLIQKNSPSSKEGTEKMVVIENDDTTIIWERESFEDKTTDKRPSTKAKLKGGSKTLEIIKPEDEDDSDENEEPEIPWIQGIW